MFGGPGGRGGRSGERAVQGRAVREKRCLGRRTVQGLRGVADGGLLEGAPAEGGSGTSGLQQRGPGWLVQNQSVTRDLPKKTSQHTPDT